MNEDETEEFSSIFVFLYSEMTRLCNSYMPTYEKLEMRLDTAKDHRIHSLNSC